jgi:diguanylate cyclase (GGDEF)-like protein
MGLMDALGSLIEGVTALPSLPTIAVRIIQEIKKERSSMGELAKIISYDPALTTKILRIANSSFYALPYKVDTIERAVNIMGMEALKNIALSFVIVKGFKKQSVDKFDYELFWKRSITAAVSAEMIAKKLGLGQEDVFVTALLMDIGVIVMYKCRPDDYMKVIDEKMTSNLSTNEAERAIFTFDHADVGSEILKKWGIPDNIYLPIAYHHNNGGCPKKIKRHMEILMLASMSSSVYHSNKSTEKFTELREHLKDKLSLSDEGVRDFIDLIADRTVDVLSTFEMNAGDMKPYSQILEEANVELGKLNLSYEQLVIELRQEKKKVESLASELKGANEKLRSLAFTDGLTGLYNHRFFQDMLDREMNRVERYSRSLSLILIDIDHFKNVNDTYGHPQGDAVLSSIAKLFEDTIRRPDMAARYGGEEFAIVLPETNTKGAVVLAERLRKLVEDKEFPVEDKLIRVTISLGVTTYDSSAGKKTKDEVIAAADKALYNSKGTGRNKLSLVA